MTYVLLVAVEAVEKRALFEDEVDAMAAVEAGGKEWWGGAW
jgi:hypothetical protein